jgi:predicted metal-dependent peptidase
VDCSGSISDKLLSRFSAEVNAIAAETRPELVRVLYCDAAIQRVDEFAAGEQIELNPAGGGGTDFRPVFAYLEERQIEPRCLIFLTDLGGSFPHDTPSYPVIWAATSERTAPFGETVAIDSEI